MGKMQCLVNDMNTWCMKNDMKLNQTKCKDMIISFALEHPKLDPIFIEKHELVPVSLAKILGMYISLVLKWNTHITHIVSKACKRLYFLSLLKRSGADRSSLLTVFTTCIRPVLEYGCQAWSYGITQYLSDEIERIQKRALKIIHPDLSSRESLEATLLPSNTTAPPLHHREFSVLPNPFLSLLSKLTLRLYQVLGAQARNLFPLVRL